MSTFLSQAFGALVKPFQWWVVIAPWEAALRVRWGRHVKVLAAGIHFRIPFIDRIFAQSTRLRTVTDSGITVTTQDRKTAVLSIGVEYRIADIHAVYRHLAAPEATLLSRCAQAINTFASQHDADAITGTGVECGMGEAAPWDRWGLADVRVMVLSFSMAKPYRFLMNDYRNYGGLADIEKSSGLR